MVGRTLVIILCSAALVASSNDVPAVALFDFSSREPDELSVRRGEALTVSSDEAPGEEGWAFGRTADGRQGLLPRSYVRLQPSPSGPAPPSAPVRAEVTPGGGASVVAAAAAAASAAASEDPAVASALWRYRNRRAAYNGPAQLLERWGVSLELEAAGLPIRSAAELEAEAAAGGAEPLEHRSGVGGVPFFNLVEYMDEGALAAEIVTSLRDEWLPDYPRGQPFLPGLEQALAAAAARAPPAGAADAFGTRRPPSRDVVLTFANLGYADFVLNGFGRDAVPNTLVVALDARAHAVFERAGLVSFFDASMPTIGAEQQDHRTAGFMDMMKLRLLYAAEALLRGFSILLTDADAVFVRYPFGVFEPAALSVACDATIVPRSWREAPGMVMAGFWYARAGVRPIILLKETLDYQARHPEQHDQQSFNQILSELLVADLSVSVMHPRLFPNGFQYFVKRTVQREGGEPLVVQNNWMMGADNKRHRFREAHLWALDPPAYYGAADDADADDADAADAAADADADTAAATSTAATAPPLRLLRYLPEQPRVSGMLRETSALRSALRLAALLNRTLVLPTFCAFAADSGLTPPPPLQYRDQLGGLNLDVLDDTVDGDWCTMEWYYDMQAMAAEFGGESPAYREASFVGHPRVPKRVLDTGGLPPFFIEADAAWRLVPPPDGATALHPAGPRPTRTPSAPRAT